MNMREKISAFASGIDGAKLRRRVLGGFLALCVVGGIGVAGAHYYKAQQREKVDRARNAMIRSQAAAENKVLLSEDAVKAKVAAAVGKEQNELTFERINLFGFDEPRMDFNHGRDRKEHEKGPVRERNRDGRSGEGREKAMNDDFRPAPPQGKIPMAREDVAVPLEAAQGQPPATGEVSFDGRVPMSIPPADGTSPLEGAAQPNEAPDRVALPKPTVVMNPVYRVLATHDGVDYAVTLDAVTGDILQSRLDGKRGF